MLFRSLFAVASVVSTAFASVPIAFTSVPAVVVTGQTYNITWGGGDGTGATLTLRQGDINNLNTVAILGTNLKEYYYLWQVSPLLATASNYALQITQGLDGINYSGMVSLVGGTGTSSISYSGYTTSTSTQASNSTTVFGGSAASMGTGTAMSRNTTFSAASLSSTRTSTTTHTNTTTATATTVVASNTSSATGNAAANNMGSSAALVMGLLGAIMFLH